MAILPYHPEYLLCTVNMVSAMDLKSYRSVSLHAIPSRFSRAVSSRHQSLSFMIMPAVSTSTPSTESHSFFQNTKFLVDRFHWRGYVGCSRGYCLDAYKGKGIKAINSQVNEQANSGLQRIRGQLAYMSVMNFKLYCALFLALKNMDKISVLCVTNLVL